VSSVYPTDYYKSTESLNIYSVNFLPNMGIYCTAHKLKYFAFYKKSTEKYDKKFIIKSNKYILSLLKETGDCAVFGEGAECDLAY
jgi:hypothetical protein